MIKRNIFLALQKVVLLGILIGVQNMMANNLQWTKESNKRLNWYDAKKYCASLKSRLPTYKEIESIWLKYNKSSEIEGFNLSVSYWTSKIEKTNYKVAYPFYFGEGEKG